MERKEAINVGCCLTQKIPAFSSSSMSFSTSSLPHGIEGAVHSFIEKYEIFQNEGFSLIFFLENKSIFAKCIRDLFLGVKYMLYSM